MNPHLLRRLTGATLYRLRVCADHTGTLRLGHAPPRVHCTRELPADYAIRPHTLIHQPRVTLPGAA